VRTIRYWSDEGVLHPVTHSEGGYRLYDAESVARLELIRTLRELGLGLDAVRSVVAGETTVAEVAATHVAALEPRSSPSLNFVRPGDPT
jgi:DNA-binding transcriptional MerR regulator